MLKQHWKKLSPQLKSMLSAKLEEMELDEEKEEHPMKMTKKEKEMSNPVMRRGLKGDDKEEKRTEKEKMREE